MIHPSPDTEPFNVGTGRISSRHQFSSVRRATNITVLGRIDGCARPLKTQIYKIGYEECELATWSLKSFVLSLKLILLRFPKGQNILLKALAQFRVADGPICRACRKLAPQVEVFSLAVQIRTVRSEVLFRNREPGSESRGLPNCRESCNNYSSFP